MVTAIERNFTVGEKDTDRLVKLECGPDGRLDMLCIDDNWCQVSSITNLWDITGGVSNSSVCLNMKFKAVLENGRDLILSYDLLNESWYLV